MQQVANKTAWANDFLLFRSYGWTPHLLFRNKLYDVSSRHVVGKSTERLSRTSSVCVVAAGGFHSFFVQRMAV